MNLKINDLMKSRGAYIFSYKVNNPEEFGVAELDSNNNVVSIEEKPKNPKSNNAVVGVYVYDDTVMKKIETLVEDINKLFTSEDRKRRDSKSNFTRRD